MFYNFYIKTDSIILDLNSSSGILKSLVHTLDKILHTLFIVPWQVLECYLAQPYQEICTKSKETSLQGKLLLLITHLHKCPTLHASNIFTVEWTEKYMGPRFWANNFPSEQLREGMIYHTLLDDYEINEFRVYNY